MNYHKTNSTTVQKVEFDRPQSTLNFFCWLYSNMSLKLVIFSSVVLGLGFLYFCGKWTKKYNRQQPYYFGKFDFRTHGQLHDLHLSRRRIVLKHSCLKWFVGLSYIFFVALMFKIGRCKICKVRNFLGWPRQKWIILFSRF